MSDTTKTPAQKQAAADMAKTLALIGAIFAPKEPRATYTEEDAAGHINKGPLDDTACGCGCGLPSEALVNLATLETAGDTVNGVLQTILSAPLAQQATLSVLEALIKAGVLADPGV